MKTVNSRRILAVILAVSMMLSMMLVFTVSGGAETTAKVYELNVSGLDTFAVGDRENGDYYKMGTDNYFTTYYSDKTKLEKNEKTFSGTPVTKRISWGTESTIGDQILNAIRIDTKGSATVEIWWVCGDDNNQVAIFNTDGSVLTKTAVEASTKNTQYVSTLSIPAAGTYYIGNVSDNNWIYYVKVVDNADGEATENRGDWASVNAPSITSTEDNGEGNINVKVKANIGNDGADELIVKMYKGDELIATKSVITPRAEHKVTFYPSSSGNYRFETELVRAGEETKPGAGSSIDFAYPLYAPVISSVNSIGGGKIEIVWGGVREAEAYDVYQNDVKIATITDGSISYIAEGLTIDERYTYTVAAVRGSESQISESMAAIATKDEQLAWGFTIYGPSTNNTKNGYEGSVSADGKVTVYSEGGKGKIVPASVDGLAFYYTAVPTEYNFTLRAKISVDKWTISNGQEGFGLLATDRLGTNGNTSNFWNNQYFAGSTKYEYRYNSDTEKIVDMSLADYPKYSMKLGIGSVAKTGITKDNLSLIEKGDQNTINNEFLSVSTSFETTAASITDISGTYNVIGNYTSKPTGTLEERFLITEYVMEIQKNNTGYFISYYDLEGNLIYRQKNYDPNALSQLDEDYVYVGFCAARNARATFSDIEFSTILASEDAPAEEVPITYITPDIVVNSATVTTSDEYTLILDPSVDGFLTVKYGSTVITENEKLTAEVRYKTTITLTQYDENYINIEFTPDPDAELPKYTELSSKKTLYKTHTVDYNKGNSHRKTIYVSPNVKPYTTVANGTKEFPYDIYTAVDVAYPGQTIILMEGTYKMDSSLKIQRGIDGTAENPIRMIADPEAETRPVIDFQGLYSGITHGGDYWYFCGFDVTGSMDGQKGFQVSGNYNILDQIHAYYNGNTGIQISRYAGADPYEDWPAYNLILNCTSYCNFDAGFEDADGFAAKLTVGEGNVFDGCIAYNNADDGWDLYAKIETGSIGSVTIRNCVAYENGFVPGIAGKTGNGNGFKMGGDSLSGKHVLENSIAFNNLSKGIDSNSCPDIIVKDCISFNNGTHNVALYTNNASNTAFVANGIISFRDKDLAIVPITKEEENIKSKGSQIADDCVNDSTYYWDSATGKSVNSSGVEITADMFVSLVYDGFERNADGSLNLKGFLEIKDNIPENVKNCKLGGQPSYDTSLKNDGECTFSEEWSNLDIYAHWHECECGFKTDIEYHNFEWIIDKEVVGMQTGLKHEECTICGFKRAAITTYPERPDNGNDPIVPDTQQPDNGEIEDSGEQTEEELSFFDKIIKAISDFFASIAAFFAGLFGGDKH